MRTNYEFQRRIDACAVIFYSDKPEKVARLAEKYGDKLDICARKYILGSLKAAVRRGSARTIEDALEQFEVAQVGDRLASVRNDDPLGREVVRINAINDTKGGKGASHRRSMGRVLGTIYVEYDEAIAATEPYYVMQREAYDTVVLEAEDAIERYIAEYVTRLSRTARASIHAIVSASYSVDAIMAARDVESAKLKASAKYLHHNFPKADVLTCREYVEVLRKYA